MKIIRLFLPVLGLLPASMMFGAETSTLTLDAARALALKMHPRITMAQLQALAARQNLTESRAGFLPFVAVNATAVGTGEAVTRLAAGALSNSQLYDHIGAGVTMSQLITDFGRTANLTAAAKSRVQVSDAKLAEARARLLLAVDAAYLAALQARAVKVVADRTVASRQLLLDRIAELAKNQLKSELEVRFARVGVGEAQLLADKANNDWQSALATLGNLLGQRVALNADLAEVPLTNEVVPEASAPLEEEALRRRPELRRLQAEQEAARSAARAARDSRLPTIMALGTAGVVPVGSVQHFEHDYAAAGVNVNLPLFTGGLYRAREREAELQAEDADASLQQEENDILRDVRLAWLEASHARERVALSANLLENASAALELARARFDKGLSSILELNQADLAKLSAEIAHTNAQYDFKVRCYVLDFQTGSLN